MVVRHVGLAVVAVVGTGFAGAGVMLVPQSVPGAMVLGSLAGTAGFALVVGQAETPPDGLQTPRPRRRPARIGLIAAGAVTAAVLTLTGMVAVLGAATAPVLLLGVAAAAPWAWTRLAPRLLPRPDPRSVGRCPVEPSPAAGRWPLVTVLETLSTPALCRQWQRSYLVLTAATDPATREQVVALRRRYLDELDRRDPAAVTRWLAADLRPAGTNPVRHLSPVLGPNTTQRPPAGTDPPGVSP